MPFDRVKQFKQVMVDYDCSGTGTPTLTVAVFTDMPGSAMASRKSVALAATTGRQTKNIPLDGVEGTLIEFSFTPSSTAVARLYGATLQLRAVGVYLDGTNGEIWQTQPMGFGI
jgi:hypothetical protein